MMMPNTFSRGNIGSIAHNLKSQKQNRKMMNENGQIEFEDKKDEETIINILKGMKNRGKNIKKRIEYIKQFMFNTMHELCYENNDPSEQKINQNETHLSQLIDTDAKEMCDIGHSYFQGRKDLVANNACIKCGSMVERKYCNDCSSYNKNDFGASLWGSGLKSSDVKGDVYCLECRKKNAEIISKKLKSDKIKSEIIRTELVANPNCELDLLCNMARARSVNLLLKDINALSVDKRAQWMVLMLDMDYLKAWNTAIGHVSTDKLIKAIGDIMHKYSKQLNNGKWPDYDKRNWDCGLKQSFVFRTGGDEFVMVVQTGYAAARCKLYDFYTSFRAEINGLGHGQNILQFVKRDDWNKVRNKIANATDRQGNKINLSIVGISCGIFIPGGRNIESNWLEIADKIPLETAKKTNGLKKNGCCIYFEDIGKVISKDKTDKCLKMGLWSDGKNNYW